MSLTETCTVAASPMPVHSETTTITMPITGMTCANCAGRIEKAIAQMPGVAEANVNFATEMLTVAYDQNLVSPRALAQQVDATGYHVPANLLRLNITGMTCAGCAGRIEKVLRTVPGVETAQVNLATEVAAIAVLPGTASTEELIATVEKAGFGASSSASASAAYEQKEHAQRQQDRRELLLLAFCATLTLPLMAPMLTMPFGIHWMVPGWVQLLLATPVQVFAGARFYRGAWSALAARSANMDVLVAMGTTAAFALSLVQLASGGELYFEGAAAILTFVRLGKWLETRAKRSTTAAIQSLMALRPDTARVRRTETVGDTAEFREITVPAESVGRGDIVVVRPGERIPVDGRIVEGVSQLDESLLTGESMPQNKGIGDDVTGGSMNGDGLLAIATTNVGDKSRLAQILTLVQDAQANKAPIQKSVDKVSAVFVPVVVLCALFTLGAWLLTGHSGQESLIVAVSVLVIACPCALGLATPATLMVGTGAAARAGILIKNAEALERTRDVDVVIFDKTGTLTEGHPKVQTILAKAPETVLALAAAAQFGSEHPLAIATVAAAKERNLTIPTATNFQALIGRGVQAEVEGRSVVVGSPRLMKERGLDLSEWQQQAQDAESAGMTVVWVATEEQLLGALALGDVPRTGSAAAIALLHKSGIETILLTGDNQRAAQAIGKTLGVRRVIAEALPEDKAREITQLQAAHHVVAMVGDGVNDAPALALADVSFAMSTGSDVAMHSASVTLMRPEPTLIADAIALSKATTRKLHQNLFWAFAYNSIGIPLAALGFLSPMIAGAAMAFSSVSVLANALLLRRWKPTEPTA